MSEWVSFKVKLNKQLMIKKLRENRGSHLKLFDILDGALLDALQDDAELLSTDLCTLYEIEQLKEKPLSESSKKTAQEP